MFRFIDLDDWKNRTGIFINTETHVSIFQHPAHTAVLSLFLPSLSVDPSPLNGLPDRVTEALLHFIYGECVWPGETSSDVIDASVGAAEAMGAEGYVAAAGVYKRKSALSDSEFKDALRNAENIVQLRFFYS